MVILVIGAGVIGVSIADALAVGGAEVVLVDMRSPGRGASQASAGVLAPYTEARRDSPLLTLGARSLAMFDAFVDSAARRSGRSIEYAKTGTLEVALDEARADELRATASWIRDAGVPCDWLDAATARAVEPSIASSTRGAMSVGAHGFVAVTELVAALTQAARFSGAVLETTVEVVEVMPGENGVDVRAGDRSWSADSVVMAAGSWTNRIRVRGVPSLPPVRPVRGQLLHLKWNAPARPTRVVWGPDCYTVPWRDGSLLVGATVEDVGFDERSTVDGVAALTDAVRTLLPATASASLEAVRVGLRPATPDGVPFIGPLDAAPQVVMATGHYRNGVLLAPLTADVIARWMLQGEHDPVLDLARPDRTLETHT